MRKAGVVIWLAILVCLIGVLFWYNSWVYSLPTPIPKNYKAVAKGQFVQLGAKFKDYNSAPLFLHFFNPDCPCSRFNIRTFKTLARQYRGRVNFAIVVLSNRNFSVQEIQEKFDLNIPVFFDHDIATACGVYSTPQVALLDAGHKLYYRGNYNSSRYCTDEKTSYAKIAINGLLNRDMHLAFGRFALTAYGCKLPGCTY